MRRLYLTFLGILTAIPGFYMVYFMFAAGDVPFSVIARIHLGVIVLIVVVTIIYVRSVMMNTRVPTESKPLWIVVVILGGFVAQIVYFWLYLWREEKRTVGNANL